MQSVILAAGTGSRLMPITANIPKCLVQLNGKSILAWQMDAFDHINMDVTDICVVGGYKAEKIPDLGFHKVENNGYLETNMVESFFCAYDWLRPQEGVIVSYGDIIYEKEILGLLLDENDDDLSIIVDKKWLQYWKMRMINPLDDAETLEIDNRGYIRSIGARPGDYDKIHAQYIGLFKINKNALARLKKIWDDLGKVGTERGKMYMTDFLQHLIDKGFTAKAIYIENGWLEVDTFTDYQLYTNLIEDHQLDKLIRLNFHQ